ncbi:MAG: UbiD family decarboxylase [Pirellulaceae bacterium]
MGYRNLRQCVQDLESAGHLLRVEEEVDAYLEVAEIQRRVFRSGGPALLFSNVRNGRFPLVSNLFGTMDRVRFMFRDTLDKVRTLIELKIHPDRVLEQPLRYWRAPWWAWSMVPRRCKRGPILANETTIDQLPPVHSWPRDGGGYVLLPIVYTEDVDRPGLMKSNLGMYRVQLTGGQYERNREVGLHYQIHRGIGVHHTKAVQQRKPFRVNVFVGGTPAMSLAAVMPLPEGMSELMFASILAGYRIPMIDRRRRRKGGDHADAAGDPRLPIYADADFCISGTIDPDRLLPEGPFGDHLGYYSLAHDFPVLRVDRVYHRDGAIWPFTVVGRPPQEDTRFGEIIHELTGPIIPTVVPGVDAVHAVDAAGVHPLMLAIGSERYTPYQPSQRPAELLTQANAILGQGQMSLAKYLLIVNRHDDPSLDVRDIGAFFRHLLARVDWQRDLHFQTCTTMDTLDYTGSALNEGSKLTIAAVGPARRELPTEWDSSLRLPDGFDQPRICLPGVLAVRGPSCSACEEGKENAVEAFCKDLQVDEAASRYPLIVIADDSEFVARSLDNFLWVLFTRSDPAADVYGIRSFTHLKHWGCRGALVMDARSKPHHAPPLVEDPRVTKRIDAMAARGGALAKYL